MLKKLAFTGLLFTLIFINFSSVYGEGIIPEATGPVTEGCVGGATYCGDYALNDFVVLAINASRWILGIVGSLALLMFIYGGVMFLISAGSSEKIGQARKIIVAAAVGLLIVFASFLIIKFVLASMGITWNGEILQFP
ncbi:MAG: hypothetical protein WC523_03045 [Patescibacteria group bacterium]|jgi:hypothetical protein